MKISSAVFTGSAADAKKCPKPDRPEYAFIGRSNVGKSSLINMLVSQKGLAKTSQTPGKTQLINHFHINEQWYIVDLPGYGYAKVSRDKRATWSKFITDYLSNRENLITLFVLIDSRHPLQKIDEEMIYWLGENEIPFALIFTKADKVKSSEFSRNVESVKAELRKNWEEFPPIFFTSAEKKEGREPILEYIETLNALNKSAFGMH